MPKTAGFPLIESANFTSYEVNPSAQLGQLANSADGKKFRYVKNGAVALVTGHVIQSPAEDTQFKDMSVQAAVAAGQTTIPVTLGSTATTADMFTDGILVISVTPGIGQSFTIVSHDVAASGTCNFNVLEPVVTALTTSSKATVMASPYRGVIDSPTTSTGVVVGGALSLVPISYYGWVQSGGIGAALSDATATTAALQSLTPSVSTAGCVTKQVSLAQVIGTSYTAVTISAKVEPMKWMID